MTLRLSTLLCAALLLGAGFACRPPARGGTECTFDSQCSDDLVCTGGYCRVQCLEQADCLSGFFCRTSADPSRNACLPNETDGGVRTCVYHSDCDVAAHEICRGDGTCGAQCFRDYDCTSLNPDLRCTDTSGDGGYCLAADGGHD